MASASKYPIFIAFLGLLLLSTTNEARPVVMSEQTAELCQKPSETWSGLCSLDSSDCDKQCRDWERADHGACHFDWGWKCFCYFPTCN